jgi:hypothetical protein
MFSLLVLLTEGYTAPSSPSSVHSAVGRDPLELARHRADSHVANSTLTGRRNACRRRVSFEQRFMVRTGQLVIVSLI